MLLRATSESNPPRIGRTIQLSRETGLEIHPAISPDGNLVAYAAGPLQQTKIYVQQISGGRPVPLTKELPGQHYLPQWSPDGSQISFNSIENNRTEMYVIPSLGGAPRPLVDAELEGSDELGISGGRGPVWAPDGKKLAYVYRSAIFVQHLDESGASKIVDSANRWIAFIHGGYGGGAAIVSEDASETRLLVENAGVIFVGWSGDGQTVYYRASDSRKRYEFRVLSVRMCRPARRRCWSPGPMLLRVESLSGGQSECDDVSRSL